MSERRKSRLGGGGGWGGGWSNEKVAGGKDIPQSRFSCVLLKD